MVIGNTKHLKLPIEQWQTYNRHMQCMLCSLQGYRHKDQFVLVMLCDAALQHLVSYGNLYQF